MIGAYLPEERERIKRILRRMRENDVYEFACEVARKHRLPLEEVVSKRKKKPIATARLELLRLLHDECKLSWPTIGRIFETAHYNLIHASGKRGRNAIKHREQLVANEIAKWIRAEYPDAMLASELAERIGFGEWRVKKEATEPLEEKKTG